MLPRQLFVLPHPQRYLDDSAEFPESFLVVRNLILERQPSSVVVIHMHGGIHPDGLTFQLLEGDDRELAVQLQKSLHDYERKNYVLELEEEPQPITFLKALLSSDGSVLPKFLSLGVSLEGADRQYEIGSLLARALKSDQEEIAVVVVGQLSHCLTEQSAAGFVPEGEAYDTFVREALESRDYKRFMLYNPLDLELVGESLFRPLCVGLGVFESLESTPKWRLISYETPEGIGELMGFFDRED